jgi:ketosteroid isomerase-like protein
MIETTNPLQEVMAAEYAWTAAHLHGDFATIERLMAEDYIKIQPDGAVANKADVLATFETGERNWDVVGGDEYNVRIYGDTVIVVGRWTARGVNHREHFDYSAQFLSIYIKRNGHWQLVAEQSTDIA